MESGRGGGPLGGVGEHFFGGADEDPVADFVAVAPVGCGGEFLVGADGCEEFGDGLTGFWRVGG